MGPGNQVREPKLLPSLQTPDLVFQIPDPFQGLNAPLGYLVVGEQVAAARRVIPAELPVLPAQVQAKRRTVAPVAAVSELDNFDGLVDAVDQVPARGASRYSPPEGSNRQYSGTPKAA